MWYSTVLRTTGTYSRGFRKERQNTDFKSRSFKTEKIPILVKPEWLHEDEEASQVEFVTNC